MPSLFIVQDSAPRETIDLLRTAAERRNLEAWVLQASSARAWQAEAIPAGSLLYPASSSAPASLLYEALWRPDLVAFGYDERSRVGPLRVVLNQPRAFKAAGLSVPRVVPLGSGQKDLLRSAVEYVGGFPVVLRYAGHSTGLGIVRADTLEGLSSLVEHSHGTGRYPELVEFIHDATPWRVAVVGGKVAGWCRGVNPESDFRSVSSDDSTDYTTPLPEGAAELATRACAAIEMDAAGVDLLQAPNGSLCVLEANFPFYFGHLDQHGHDVAGAIVDSLLAIGQRQANSAPNHQAVPPFRRGP